MSAFCGHILGSFVICVAVQQQRIASRVCRRVGVASIIAAPQTNGTCMLCYTAAPHAIVSALILQALANLFKPLTEWVATRYRASVATKLMDYGLRYDDLYDPLMDTVSVHRVGALPLRHCIQRTSCSLHVQHSQVSAARAHACT